MIKRFFTATALVLIAYGTTPAYADISSTLTDGQMAQLMLTADQSQIDAGLAARDQASSNAVKDYAEDSILAFTSNMVEINKLEVSTGIKPEDGEANKALKDETDQNLQNLKSQKGTVFDKSYADNQVEMLKEFLLAMDLSMIPQAQNPDLKKFLQESRTVLEAQLNNAKALRAGLVKAAPRR